MASYVGVTAITTPQPATSNIFVKALFQHKFDPYPISAKLRGLNHLKSQDIYYQTNPSSVSSFGAPSFGQKNKNNGGGLTIGNKINVPLPLMNDLNLQIGHPVVITLNPTHSPNPYNTLVLLSNVSPHLSQIRYDSSNNNDESSGHYTPPSHQSSSANPCLELDYSQYRTPPAIPLYTSAHSNAVSITNGFIMAPENCTCADFFSFLQQNKNQINQQPEIKPTQLSSPNSTLNQHSSSPTSTPTPILTKCLYCYMGSVQHHEVQQTFSLLNHYLSTPIITHPLPLIPKPHTQVLISPIPSYSHAIRLKVEVIVNHDIIQQQQSASNNSRTSLHATLLDLISTDKAAVRDLLLHSPLKQHAIASVTLPNQKNSDSIPYKPAIIIRILETYPAGIVLATPTTVMDIVPTIISSRTSPQGHQKSNQSTQSNDQKAASVPVKTPTSPTVTGNAILTNRAQEKAKEAQQRLQLQNLILHTRLPNNRFGIKLFPLPYELDIQTISIQMIFRLLWINLNKYFYSAISRNFNNLLLNSSTSIPDSTQAIISSSPLVNGPPTDYDNAYTNLNMTTIKGILLHGPPGVGKTFAAIKALELIPAALLETLNNSPITNRNDESCTIQRSPTDFINLPILQSLSTFQSKSTLSYPVVRFCTIDSGSIGDYTPGQSESRIDNVFQHAQQRQTMVDVPRSVLESFLKFKIGQENSKNDRKMGINEESDENDAKIDQNLNTLTKLWTQGISIQNLTATSPYTSNDRIYPLFSFDHLDKIIGDHSKPQTDQNTYNAENNSITQLLPSLHNIQFQAQVVLTVLLIDEIDSICTSRDYSGESQNQNTSLTNHFLTLLDGLHDKTSKITRPSNVGNNQQQHQAFSPHPHYTLATAILNNENQSNLPQNGQTPSPNLNTLNAPPYNTILVPETPTLTQLSPAPLFVIGTTNNPNNVDIAIKRSGRLDQLLTVPPPNAQQRYQLLLQLTKNIQINKKIDLEAISESCIGYVAADLANLVRVAQSNRLKKIIKEKGNILNTASLVLSDHDTCLGIEDFIDAIQNTGASSLRKNAYSMLKHTLNQKQSLLSNQSQQQQQQQQQQQEHCGEEKNANPEENQNQIENLPSGPPTTLFPLTPQETLHRSLIGTFASSIGGLYEAKLRLLESVVWPIKYRRQCTLLNLTPPRGILLHGPPGNGKTTLARAVCMSLNATFISLDMASVYNSYLGESERHLREIFSKARDNAPAVIFIDELDSIVSKRNMGDGGNGGSNDVQGRILSTLLNEMDGIPTTSALTTTVGSNSIVGKSKKNQKNQSQNGKNNNDNSSDIPSPHASTILVFGATNRLDMLDAALLRPGRFDYIIPIPNCTERTSYEILTSFCQGKIDPKIDLFLLNKRLFTTLSDSGLGANGANITNAVYQTANIAVKRYIKKLELIEGERSHNYRQSDENNVNGHENNPRTAQRTVNLWDENHTGDTLGLIHRHGLDDYFTHAEKNEYNSQFTQSVGDNQGSGGNPEGDYPRMKPIITLDDFDAYLKPLEALIEEKKKQVSF